MLLARCMCPAFTHADMPLLWPHHSLPSRPWLSGSLPGWHRGHGEGSTPVLGNTAGLFRARCGLEQQRQQKSRTSSSSSSSSLQHATRASAQLPAERPACAKEHASLTNRACGYVMDLDGIIAKVLSASMSQHVIMYKLPFERLHQSACLVL